MTFDKWWDEFTSEHEDWKYADSETLRHRAYEAGAASRDAEIAELQRKLDNEQARDIHSCHPNCTREGCVNRKLRAELEAARAEIEQLKRAHRAHEDSNLKMLAKLKAQAFELADEQAKNVGLREAANRLIFESDEYDFLLGMGRGAAQMFWDDLQKTLAAPPDTSALEAIVKKAGEVMREQSMTMIANTRSTIAAYEAIRALPAVTLEDLK